MITKSEMIYINNKANRTPFPGAKYARKTLEKLKECYDFYNKTYADKTFSILFSNNEEITFEIARKNLAHILGIEYKNLTSDYKSNYRKDALGLNPDEYVSSFSLLESIIDNSDYIVYKDTFEERCNGINYFRVNVKCDIFLKLCYLSKFNYGCINFDKEVFNKENPNFKFSPSCTKLFYTDSEEAISPYFMMGIKVDNASFSQCENPDFLIENDEKKYIVETTLAVENPKAFFINQEVVIPTQILINDNGVLSKETASASDKLKLLKEYRSVVERYNIPNNIDIYGDYYSMIVSDSKKLSLK